MSGRVADERSPELEQPDPIGLGDESVSYRGFFGRGGQADIHMVRVGHLVWAITDSGDGPDMNEVTSVVTAMESSASPSITAFRAVVEGIDLTAPAAVPTRYSFTSWSLPLGDVGDVGDFSFGYERNEDDSCTHWSGDVEPMQYTTYTETEDSIQVSFDSPGDPVVKLM